MPDIILASRSAVRQRLLEEAGVPFAVHPSPFDEEAHKRILADLPPEARAQALAQGKAEAVSVVYPQALVIGADQICVTEDGACLDKPKTAGNARAQLMRLQGRTHRQISAACVVRGGEEVLWEGAETARLTMRSLSEEEIAAYVARDAPLQSCGAYTYEVNGAALFRYVEGERACILGLPLAGLLAALQRFS